MRAPPTRGATAENGRFRDSEGGGQLTMWHTEPQNPDFSHLGVGERACNQGPTEHAPPMSGPAAENDLFYHCVRGAR